MSQNLEAQLRAMTSEIPPSFRRGMRTIMKRDVKSSKSLMDLVTDETLTLQTRATACWILGRLKDKKAVRVLLRALGEGNTPLIWEAAKALVRIGSKKAIPALVEVLMTDESADKKAAAAHALGALGDARAAESLLGILSNNKEDPIVRGHAAEALAHLKEPRSVDGLIRALRDKSSEVRFWAAFSLGELGDPRALTPLRRVKARDRAVVPGWWEVGKEAANAIERIKRVNKTEK